MTTSTMEHTPERRKATWEPDWRTILGLAAVVGAVTALCEDTTLRLVLWAFLG